MANSRPSCSSASNSSTLWAEELRKTIQDEISRALHVNKNNHNNTRPKSSSSGSSSTDKTNNDTMTFEEFYMKRERARQDDFNPKSKKKAKFQKDIKKSGVKEVEIKVGLAYS